MAIQPEVKLITEAELMALGSDARVEVVEGEIVEMAPVGMRHQFVGGNFYDPLKRSSRNMTSASSSTTA